MNEDEEIYAREPTARLIIATLVALAVSGTAFVFAVVGFIP